MQNRLLIKAPCLSALQYLAASVFLSATPFAPMAAEEPSWNFHLRGMAASYDEQHPLSILKDPRGVELGLEYRMRPSFGLEFAVGRAHFQARTHLGPAGYLALHPVTLTARFHHQLSPGSAVYLGPQFGWAIYSTSGHLSDRRDEALVGAKAGLEFRLGRSRWLGGLEIRRFKAEPLFRYPDRQIHRNINVTFVSFVLSYSSRTVPEPEANELGREESGQPDA